jgi:cystathionine gamma-synthase
VSSPDHDDDRQPPGLGTRAVHAGEDRPKPDNAITTPVALTSTYTFQSTAELRDHFEGHVRRQEYGRYGNPTVDRAEKKIAALDGAEDAALFASGMAAITTSLLALLSAGQHLVMTDDCYRRTRQFVRTVLGRLGVDHTIVQAGDYEALEAAIRPGETRLIVSESPTNPYLFVVDLPRLVAIAKRHRGVKTLIDSTFATPINHQPMRYGIDLVTHSATKYLGGHNDLLAGSISGRHGLVGAIRELRDVLGGVLDPQSAYLLIRGLKTLHLRVARQNASALALAQWLEGHEKVARVWYPGLPSHPQHGIAREQMTGFGGVVTFELVGALESTSRFIDACTVAQLAPSLGGVESLIEQPALMSYYELTTEQREAIGIRDSLVRMAVGVEDVEDLRRDLERALEAV